MGRFASHVTNREQAGGDIVRTVGRTLIGIAIELAALFHDIGKIALAFQDKLLPNATARDVVRHEILSAVAIEEMARHPDWLVRLSGAEAGAFIAEAYARACARLADELSFSEPGGHPRRIDLLVWKDQCRFGQAVALIVATHHRLLAGDSNGSKRRPIQLKSWHHVTHREGHYEIPFDVRAKAKRVSRDALYADMMPRPGASPLWEDDSFLKSVASAATRALEVISRSVAPLDDDWARLAFQEGRLALMLGDHKASSLKQATQAVGEPGTVYANTVRNLDTGSSYMAQTLARHTTLVGRCASSAYGLLDRRRGEWSRLTGEDVPELVADPPAETPGSPFAWQRNAWKEIRRHRRKNESEKGFFGVVMAGTGSGKTTAVPIVMNAATGGLRYTLGLGLRALTLQAGREYSNRMRIPASDCAVVVGSQVTQSLFELRSLADESGESASLRPMASDVDGSDGPTEVMPDLAVVAGGEFRYPPGLDRLFTLDEIGKVRSIVAPAILVCTLDTVAAAADARRASHLVATLRIATSDLVLDEIDDYGPEDLAAIGRLLYLVGLHGRNAVISSATISPPIAKALYASWKSGWDTRARVEGESLDVTVAWLADAPGTIQVLSSSGLDFDAAHDAYATGLAERTKVQPIRRRATLCDLRSDLSLDGFNDAAFGHALDMHRDNHAVDPRTGKRVSIGAIRFNNVAGAFDFARRAQSYVRPGIDVRMVCYVGTLSLAIRHSTEIVLDAMLNRKSGRSPVSHPAVRAFLDESPAEDCLIIVATTSMEEVGRDHDFDYAIMEPGSYRSAVQIAGRIRRHRQESWNGYNLGILRLPRRAYRSPNRDGWYANPGIETALPFEPDGDLRIVRTARQALASFPQVDARSLYDLVSMSRGVDASSVVSPNAPESKLAEKEREIVRGYLDPTAASHLSPQAYGNVGPAMMASTWQATHRRFRRKDVGDVLVWPEPQESLVGASWFLSSDHQDRTPISSVVSLVEDVPVDLFLLGGLSIMEEFNRLVEEIGLSRDRAFRDLLGISLQYWSTNQRLLYHPLLGAVQDSPGG